MVSMTVMGDLRLDSRVKKCRLDSRQRLKATLGAG
jgi:hypothetical protein